MESTKNDENLSRIINKRRLIVYESNLVSMRTFWINSVGEKRKHLNR